MSSFRGRIGMEFQLNLGDLAQSVISYDKGRVIYAFDGILRGVGDSEGFLSEYLLGFLIYLLVEEEYCRY